MPVRLRRRRGECLHRLSWCARSWVRVHGYRLTLSNVGSGSPSTTSMGEATPSSFNRLGFRVAYNHDLPSTFVRTAMPRRVICRTLAVRFWFAKGSSCAIQFDVWPAAVAIRDRTWTAIGLQVGRAKVSAHGTGAKAFERHGSRVMNEVHAMAWPGGPKGRVAEADADYGKGGRASSGRSTRVPDSRVAVSSLHLISACHVHATHDRRAEAGCGTYAIFTL